MQNDAVTSPHVRPRDCSYYAVYHNPCVTSSVVNCIMQMWKVALCAGMSTSAFLYQAYKVYFI